MRPRATPSSAAPAPPSSGCQHATANTRRAGGQNVVANAMPRVSPTSGATTLPDALGGAAGRADERPAEDGRDAAGARREAGRDALARQRLDTSSRG